VTILVFRLATTTQKGTIVAALNCSVTLESIIGGTFDQGDNSSYYEDNLSKTEGFILEDSKGRGIHRSMREQPT
jgi:hypothetical protein